MEYCTRCRALRPTRKSTRKRQVRQPDGSMKTVVADSYHCARCNHFLGSIDREPAPAPTPAPDAEPTPEAEESVEVAAVTDEDSVNRGA